MQFFTFLPAVLAVVCVSGVFRPWNVTAEQWAEGGPIFAIVSFWAALPAVLGLAVFLLGSSAAWRMTIGVYLSMLGFFWFGGSAITLPNPDFDGNLGLIFWPALHLIGLFLAAIVGAIAAATADNHRLHLTGTRGE